MLHFFQKRPKLRVKNILFGSSILPGNFIPGAYYYPTNKHKKDLKETFTDVKSYNHIVADFLQNNYQSTPTPISFLGIKLESTKREVLKALGLPNAIVNLHKGTDVNIFYYKQTFGKQNVRVDFHFFKKNLFLITAKFSVVKKTSKQHILKVLFNKYHLTPLNKEIAVKDASNHAMLVKHDVGLELNYCSLNSGFHQLLELENKKETIRIQHIKEKQLRDFYYNL
ncbi:hypothetical protein [Ochrovirga pacifica]|uniref:hypothetical protein n=1 Tax=Ochrovirga pacifica TaxID=1042376 RepID=UPI0002558775|nr:hypothetical protein [Ochrovirga pacifica]